MRDKPLQIAATDVFAAIKKYSLVAMLGWQDVRQRYRRSTLGPFWLTISMGVMIGTIGIVFGQIFQAPMTEYLPFLAVGLIFWGFISGVITEGCVGFVAAENIIKQLPIPLFVHVLRVIWRNLIIFFHNAIILPIVFVLLGSKLDWAALLAIPGLFLAILNLTWIALILSTLCTRYRDLPQMVNSILQIFFYLTPIMWMPSLLPERAALAMLSLNPVFHIIEIVRAPLLAQQPSVTSWVISIVLAVIGWTLTLLFYGRYKRRIPYWL